MTVLEAIVVVAGCGIGLATNGAVGAAIGSAIGYGAAMIVDFGVAHARAGLRIPILPTTFVVVAVSLMAAVILLLPGREMLRGGAVTHIVLVVSVGGATYCAAILALFPVVTRSVWAQGKRLVARSLV